MYIISALLDGSDVADAMKQSRQHWEKREQLIDKIKQHEISSTDQQPSDRDDNSSVTLGDRT